MRAPAHTARVGHAGHAAHAGHAGHAAHVAVVGAGLAGLACAGALAGSGLAVTVFEKSRGPGGRAATRHTARDADGQPAPDAIAFDHGAQYATARDPRFVARLDAWARAGRAAEWTGRIVALAGGELSSTPDGAPPVRRWVGVPGMSAFGRALLDEARAAGATLAAATRIVAAERAADGWRLHDVHGAVHGPFAALVVAVPAPQAAPLLAAVPALAHAAAAAPMTPCWSAMLAVAAPLGLAYDGAFVNAGDGARAAGSLGGGSAPAASDAAPRALAWLARDASKPGRRLPDGVAETWVLHATAAWSAVHLERTPEEVAPLLLAAFAHETRLPVHAPIVQLRAHRWRYATPDPALPEPALWDATACLAACGDWCGGPRVEGAFLSGLAAAERVRAALG